MLYLCYLKPVTLPTQYEYNLNVKFGSISDLSESVCILVQFLLSVRFSSPDSNVKQFYTDKGWVGMKNMYIGRFLF